MPGGEARTSLLQFSLEAPRLVQGFGCSVGISQLKRMLHLAVECNNVPSSRGVGGEDGLVPL